MLYFHTSSRDPDDAILAEGFTEELINSLGRVDSLVVSSRGLVRRFRDQETDPIAAGRALNTAWVVSGSLSRGSGRVRVRVELARASNGAIAWSGAFERPSSDVMILEADLAAAVAQAVAGRLRPQDRAAIARQPTRVTAAWEQYVRGNVLIARRETGGVADAIRAYEEAVRLDPGFAAAWGRLAEGLALAAFYEGGDLGADSAARKRRAQQAAARALALDSASAEAWMAQGMVLADEDASPSARIAAFARAVALDSTVAELHYHLGNSLRAQSMDQATAERHLRLAHTLDPSLINAVRWLADLLWKGGRTYEALAWFDTLATMAPDLARRPLFADAHIELRLLAGDSAGARTEVMELLAPPLGNDSTWRLAIAARVLAQLGDSAFARATLRRAEQGTITTARPRTMLALAAARAALGERPRALDMLEEHRAVDGSGLWDGLRASYFDPLRRDPRFARLVESAWPR